MVRIGKKDVYHFECQITPKGNMVIRMYEYDTQIALVHGVGIHKEDKKTFVEMPNSIILYLIHTKNTPDFEKMQILLPDGNIWNYQVPVLKVQNYSLEMIREKKLYFLIPLTTIRYYSAKTKKKVELEECPFEQFLMGNIVMVQDAVRDGYLSDKTGRDILDLLNRGCQYLFAEDTDTLEVVKRIMEPVFKLGREIFEEEATERITQEVTERVTCQVTEDVTRQVEQSLLHKLMDNTNMTEEEAKRVLGIV